ncbi:tRNA-specific adenosine deaminase [Maribacter thermophilus]|uniref:hypothetical protein n=1 Tax=Maribacter thermophilus TaxID=1197874 RepID=UPI00069A4249|nr:hypothetical protein [Maribacter thermophilus]
MIYNQVDNSIQKYNSCEPYPMCLGAIYWARPKAVFYACTKEDAKAIDFGDQFIYDKLDKKMADRQIKFIQLLRNDTLPVFKSREEKNDKTEY